MPDDYEMKSALRRAMTVADLIEQLGDMDPNAKVFFVCDYGDYHHTQQALPVVELDEADGDQAYLQPSAYSQSRVAFVEATEEIDEETDPEEQGDVPHGPVVILRMERKY